MSKYPALAYFLASVGLSFILFGVLLMTTDNLAFSLGIGCTAAFVFGVNYNSCF